MSHETASVIVWRAHGSPVGPLCSEADGLCWICAGHLTRGVLVSKWMGANFVGQNRVRYPPGTHACEACIYVMAGKPPDTLRMQSHLWDEVTGYQKPIKSREGLREMVSFLRRQHAGAWLAAIGESGKKHVVPWTPVNRGGTGVILFEESPITLPRDSAGWKLLDDVCELRTLGASSEEIAAGLYGPYTWQRCPVELRAFEAEHGHLRGGAWFRLTVFLGLADEARREARLEAEKEASKIKKDAEKAAKKKPAKPEKEKRDAPIRRAKGEAADVDGGGAAVVAKRVPRGRGKPAETLGPDSGEAPSERAPHDVAGGVDQRDVPKPQPLGPAQLGLFGG